MNTSFLGIQQWTVARFPNGSWTVGGAPDSQRLKDCEVFQVWASSRQQAKDKAQLRRNYRLKQQREAQHG
ncbi:hypothetical protein [Diaphorobacter caeni]|uniref:hypothetical protein n=1 Tax=Diaphorobacter caeni TaxID=2784387 RepID=UPI00188EEE92|nr:hypothetical protein [Diaphorobacter caeni]MBF5006892.1 hypothetical protein [Diaphorobacter caeni]